MTAEKILRETFSLCPHCMQRLEAHVLKRDNQVLLRRICPEHGMTEEVIWRGNPDFEDWRRPKTYDSQFSKQTESNAGCPQDCGLCSAHLQKSCAVLYELTSLCNLRCPVCFASAGELSGTAGRHPVETGEDEDTLSRHIHAVRWIHEQAGQAVLQISGGEPTLSPFLLPLVREASDLFPAVQLNTNGVLLAADKTLAFELAGAGLGWVFLQFDGTEDAIYEKLRGKALLETKLKAIRHCREAGLAVVLVPTVARGINDHDLGNIVRLGVSFAPTVRGVHFQPMTRAGRNAFAGLPTLTLPEVLQCLELQTGGTVKTGHGSPPGCEHERCSFHCRYTLQGDSLVYTPSSSCCTGVADKADYQGGRPEGSDRGANRAIASVVHNWQTASETAASDQPADSFDAFIARHRKTIFSVTCMAFQDVWNVDLERLQGCCIHVYASPGRLIPFCSYNLTDARGVPLHRQQG